MDTVSSDEPFQAAWQRAEALKQRLAGLAAQPAEQALDRTALAETAQALPAVLAELLSATQEEQAKRKRAEAALRESEARYQDLYAVAHRRARETALQDRLRLAVARALDLSVVIHSAVEGIAETFGYVLVSLYLRQGEVLVLQHQVGYKTVIREISISKGILGRVVTTGQPVLLKDAHADPAFLEAIAGIVSEVCVPLFDEGQVVGALNVESQQGMELSETDLRLITALSEQIGIAIGRARLYTQARESEARFRSLFMSMAEGVALHRVVYDELGRPVNYEIVDINPPYETILNTKREAVVHRLATEAYGTPEPPYLAEYAAVASSGQPYHFETYFGPLQKHFYISVAALGKGQFATIFFDITERKRSEAALREAREFLSSLLEHTPLSIYVTSADGRLRLVNRRWEQDTRQQREAVIGRPLDEVFPPETARKLKADNERVVETDTSLTFEEMLGTPVQLHHFLTVKFPLHNAAGRVEAVGGFSLDITERKQMEQALLDERSSLSRRVGERTAELTAANAELTRALRARDEFLAMMSHELRTPLTSILGLSESLQLLAYGPLTEKQVKSLRTIHTSGEHLLTLITDVLDLAKIGAGKLELQLDLVAVEETCQAALRLIAPQASKKNLQVTFNFDRTVAALYADARRLKQMLINLLGNAVKFTPPGGAIGLEVAGNAERQAAHFTVWDNGVGISANHLQRLFKPFVQVDSSLSRRYEGAGLGLALTRRLAELHGGGVSVESAEGQGSRFTIALPWEPRMARRSPAPESEHPASIVRADSEAPGPFILLAEDNEMIANSFTDILETQGYQVITAIDGVEALELTRTRRPALVLMDIQMPGLDGLEAIRRLRADPAVAATPIIALTALAMPGDRERCLEAGASEYLSKPVQWTELLKQVERFVK
jgi:PAS domain S-box-containing protein